MVADSIQLAHEIAYGDGPMSPEQERLVREGFRRYLEDYESRETAANKSMPLNFYLDGGSRMKARNRHLVRASVILANGQERSAWEMAGELLASIARFEALFLPSVKRSYGTPLTPLNDALRWAHLSGATWPSTRETLNTILKNGT